MAKKMRTRKRNSFKRNNNIRRKNTNRTRRKVSRKSSRKQHRRKRTNRRRLNMRGGDPPAAQSITLYRIDNDEGRGSPSRIAHVAEGWSDLMWFPTGGEIMSFIGSRTAPQDTGTYTEMEAGAPSTKIHGLDALVGSPYKAEDGAGFAIHVGPAGEENGPTLAGWLQPNMIHIFPLKDIMPAGNPVAGNPVASLTWNYINYDYTLGITLKAPPGSPIDRWKFRFKNDRQRLASATNAAKMETQAA